MSADSHTGAAGCPCDACIRSVTGMAALQVVAAAMAPTAPMEAASGGAGLPVGTSDVSDGLAALMAAMSGTAARHASIVAEATPDGSNSAMPAAGSAPSRTEVARADVDDVDSERDRDPDRYFPLPFERFLLTGMLPKVHEAATDPPPSWAPLFVVGCGRSGTTLVGRALGRHRHVHSYLNEARALWIAAVPGADVWSVRSEERGGALELAGAASLESGSAVAALRRMLWAAAVDGCRGDDSAVPHSDASLVEKLPENAFRLQLLREACPNCRILHVVRNGHSVASSIAKFSEAAWYGPSRQPKWALLAARAAKRSCVEGDGKDRAGSGWNDSLLAGGPDGGACALSMLERGYVEWAEAVLSCREQASALGLAAEGAYAEVRFEDLVTRPREEWSRLLAFAGLPPDEEAEDALAREVRPGKARASSSRRAPAEERSTARIWPVAERLLASERGSSDDS